MSSAHPHIPPHVRRAGPCRAELVWLQMRKDWQNKGADRRCPRNRKFLFIQHSHVVYLQWENSTSCLQDAICDRGAGLTLGTTHSNAIALEMPTVFSAVSIGDTNHHNFLLPCSD